MALRFNFNEQLPRCPFAIVTNQLSRHRRMHFPDELHSSMNRGQMVNIQNLFHARHKTRDIFHI